MDTPPTVQEVISTVKGHLEYDRIEKALSILIQTLDSHHEFIAFKATLHRNAEALRLGMIDFSDINLVRTKIIYSVLTRLDDIKAGLNPADHQGYRGIENHQPESPVVRSYISTQFRHLLIDLEYLFPVEKDIE